MRPFRSRPQPDIAIRMWPELWYNDEEQKSINEEKSKKETQLKAKALANSSFAGFIGEAKTVPQKTTVEAKEPSEDNVMAQRAMAVHPNLIMMILYYPDHRRSRDERLPPWMFQISIRYHDCGVEIFAYYPDWDLTRQG